MNSLSNYKSHKKLESNELTKSNDDHSSVVNLLGFKLITENESLIQFMAEVAMEKQEFKLALLEFIFKSRDFSNESFKDDIINTAANAITVLIASNYSFANMDLSRIKICGANIRDGCFNRCNFSDADLKGVTMENCKLNHCLFNRTNLKDIKLGIYPDIIAQDNIFSITCSQKDEGKEILSGCRDGSIKLYERSTGNLIKNFFSPSQITCLKISSDGSLMLSGSTDNYVRLWEITNGNLLKTFYGHTKAVYSVAFSIDESQILSSSCDFSIKLWDKTTGNIIKTFEEHTAAVYSVTFSSDGQEILSGSYDKSIILWEIESGKVLRRISVESPVSCVVFSPDQDLIVCGCYNNGSINIFDKNTGEKI